MKGDCVEGASKPQGGFSFITVVQLCLGWFAYRSGLVRYGDLRAWFACHELVARRCRLKRGRAADYAY